MLERARCNSVFVSGTPARTEPPRADTWETNPVLRRTGHGLAAQMSRLCRDRAISSIVLHVSGYGYEKRGAPLWLLRGIKLWRRTHHHCGLLGVFHELFATGRIWNSSFWLSGLQKHITRAIWDMCDGGITTTSPYFDQLVSWRPSMRGRLHMMPVFSNVGEPTVILPTEDRPAHMAVFGQPSTWQSIYAGLPYRLSISVAEKLCISKLIDIGARTISPPLHLGKIPILSFGQLSPADVSRCLMLCRFGLLNYDIARLEKSGVFAAYAAHGVIPICIGSQAKPPHGLEEGQHFLRWPLNRATDFCAIQRSLIQWYNRHSVAKHSDLLTSLVSTDVSNLANHPIWSD
jgi:hypothetical protein